MTKQICEHGDFEPETVPPTMESTCTLQQRRDISNLPSPTMWYSGEATCMPTRRPTWVSSRMKLGPAASALFGMRTCHFANPTPSLNRQSANDRLQSAESRLQVGECMDKWMKKWITEALNEWNNKWMKIKVWMKRKEWLKMKEWN